MTVLPNGFAHRFKQTIVSKSAIGNDQQWSARKSGRNFRQHFNGLLKFGLKRWYLAINPYLLGHNRFFHVIETKRQR
jgi:hypothetical protein